jgi:hypothetical protein
MGQNKYETLEEMVDAMRALPINWALVEELGIVWENHLKWTDENGNPQYIQLPNFRLKFRERPKDGD